MTVRADPTSRRSLRDAIARRLVDAGWRFRRGSTAPWVPPGEMDIGGGYSLLGAAARQAELDLRAQSFERHGQ